MPISIVNESDFSSARFQRPTGAGCYRPSGSSHWLAALPPYEEMEADNLDVLDIEAAVLTGEIGDVLTMDTRETPFVVVRSATDEKTPVAVVARFVEHDQLLVITVHEIK